MCGRYKITKPVTKTSELVKSNIKVEDTENFNAHPTQQLYITPMVALELCEWGLVQVGLKSWTNFLLLSMLEKKH